jgi:hypothetical protein
MLAGTSCCCTLYLPLLRLRILQMFPNLTIKVSEYHTNDGR